MPYSECVRAAGAAASARGHGRVSQQLGYPDRTCGVFELFAELHRLGFNYGIVTNGFYVNDWTAAGLVAAGIGSISISMDAPGEVNDQLRGPSATAKAENAIGCLRRAGYGGTLEIISTITRPVVPLLDTMRRRLSELRIANWRIAPVMPIGRAAEHPELIPGPVEIRQLLEYVRQARSDRMNPRPQFCEEGFVGNRFEGIVRPFLAQCRAGITTGGIRANGSIGACPELGDGFAQGDIRTERFRDVWQTRYQVFRQRDWTQRGRCASCEHHPRCNGGSLHLYPTPEAELLRCLYWMAREAEEVANATTV
jgi:radical SAM protein with 4Fe4S-binding SPASM domain